MKNYVLRSSEDDERSGAGNESRHPTRIFLLLTIIIALALLVMAGHDSFQYTDAHSPRVAAVGSGLT